MIQENMQGHSEANVNITVIEKVESTDKNYWKEKEQLFITFFNTDSGLNRSPK